MLINIHIRNLVTIDELDLDLQKGTTVITGETGAGKSILIDAISLALGARASSDVVRHQAEKADISLSFNLNNSSEAYHWLKNFDLDNGEECIIRRTIMRDGKSRSYINNMPITLQLLREFSEKLIDIHSQHEHLALLNPETQRLLLDCYAGNENLLQQIKLLSNQIQHYCSEIEMIRREAKDIATRSDFLKFQLQELQELGLTSAAEINSLELEHKQLAHAGELIENIQLALNQISQVEQQNFSSSLQQSLHALEKIVRVDPKIYTWIENLKNIIVQVSDLENDLEHYLQQIELDPKRLQMVEEKISKIFHLSRKHKIEPEKFFDFQEQIVQELSQLENVDFRIDELHKKIATTKLSYEKLAKKLSESRLTHAKKLSADITQKIQQLALPHAVFQIVFDSEDIKPYAPNGLEKIIFKVQTNLGTPSQPIEKIVSGGELSRISLAIQLATALQYPIPTLIFDEVDVGVGGATAETVGKLLRDLGNTHQVLCITHHPQVAALGHHHCYVEKTIANHTTFTKVKFLEREEKVKEIARMLGGIKITKTTLKHAEEMIQETATES